MSRNRTPAPDDSQMGWEEALQKTLAARRRRNTAQPEYPAGNVLLRSKTPPAVAGNHEDLYALLHKLPADKWDGMTARQQLALIQKTGLSREEQRRFLNAPARIGTLARVRDLQDNQEAYGLTHAELNHAADQPMELAGRRIAARRREIPFGSDRQRNLFLRMLSEREAQALDGAGFGQAAARAYG